MSHKPQADAIVDGTIVDADVASANKDGANGTACMRTLGTGAGQAAAGNSAEYTSNKNTASGYAGLDSNTRVVTSQLGTGTANSSVFLRGDSSWATPTATLTTTVATKTTTYTTTTTDDVILADAAGGAFTVNLHAASTATKPITVKRINSGANAVTIDPNSTETVDGSTTLALNQQYYSVTMVSNGSNWFII